MFMMFVIRQLMLMMLVCQRFAELGRGADARDVCLRVVGGTGNGQQMLMMLGFSPSRKKPLMLMMLAAGLVAEMLIATGQ